MAHAIIAGLARQLVLRLGTDIGPYLTRHPLHLQLPLNLVRAFWASVFLSLAHTTFALACPSILREHSDYDTWSKSAPEAIEFLRRRSLEFGVNAESDITTELRDKFEEARTNAAYSNGIARIATALFYTLGGVLTARILTSQMEIVLYGYSVRQVFF